MSSILGCFVDQFERLAGLRSLRPALDGDRLRPRWLKRLRAAKGKNHTPDVLSLFRQAALANPAAVAIDAGSSALTYGELDAFSSRLACHIISAHEARGKVIPLLTSLSPSAVVGMLAILKAGAAYVPIDCARCSAEHAASILDAIGGAILVYSDECCSPLTTAAHPGYTARIPISRSACWPDQTIPPLPSNVSSAPAQDMACVIFTSGTTGKPKGVMIGHGSLANFVASRAPYFDPAHGVRSLLALSIAFDACNGYLLASLCHGATVVLADPDTLQERFSTCSVAALTPSILSSLVAPGPGGGGGPAYPKLRTLILGGETSPQGLLAAWHPPGCPWAVFSDYGPTEATCGVLTGRVLYDSSRARFENALLGPPIPGAVVKLLGPDGREVKAPGAEGEILIGGSSCLALGYWRDPERTAERFVSWKGKRFYCTGDWARWWRGSSAGPEGENRRIVFLGRRDRIVKNSGFLVNLEAEVDEAVLGSDLAHSFNVSAAFSVMVDGRMCMLVSPPAVDVRGLRARLAERLPSYQVPDRISSVETIPKGRTGKVDPKAVEAFFRQLQSAEHDEEGASQLTLLPDWETQLLSAISDTLGLSRCVLPHERFIELGGNSLAAVAVSSRCQRLGIAVRPGDVLLSETLGDLLAICRQSRQPEKGIGGDSVAATGDPHEGQMTPTQRQLLYAAEKTPGSGIIQALFRFPTQALPRLKQAWQAALESETIFRMSFDPACNLQTVQEGGLVFRWEETVLQDEESLETAVRSAQSPSPSSSSSEVGTSFRVFSWRDRSCLVWTIHHLLIDGFSAALLLRKVGAALSSSEAPVPGPSFLRVLGEIRQSQQHLTSEAKAFWEQQRSEVSSPTGKLDLLPAPRPPPPDRNETRPMNAVVRGTLGVPAEGILQLATQLSVTPVTLFYMAWAILLSRYTGSSQVVFGAVLSGREAVVAGVNATIGPLLCTAALRVHVSPAASIRELARTFFLKLRSLIQYQWLPDEDEREVLHTAVASQQNFPDHPFRAELEDVCETSAVPLTLLIQDDWSFQLNYRTDKYTNAQAERLAESFAGIFSASVAAAAGPGGGVAACLQAAVGPDEERRLLELGNAFSRETFVDDNMAETALDVFERTVRRHGQLVAVEKGGSILTYRELDAASTKAARRLVQLVAPGDVVALHATRSINWIVGIWAILKAGAAYCPLDAALPAAVRSDLFERSGAKVFLTPTRDDFVFAPERDAPCLAIEEALRGPAGPETPAFQRDPRAPAYVCFTSGSTGKPKGVVVEHRSLVATLKHPASRLHTEPGRRVMQFLAVGFDGSMMELFSTLCYGATLVLRADDDDALAALQNVDIALLVPSALEGLAPADFSNLKYLYVGGEPLSQSTVDRWAPGRHLYNYYGPTEATVGSVLKRCVAGSPVTIGKPFPTVRAYVLDEHLRPVPRGVVGEIALAGIQVARGYLGMPEETSTKFLPDTISGRLDERMYLTGDLGCWSDDGEILCIGRKDRLVKVRGFRVSLGAVETALREVTPVRTAAVVASQGSLLAWVTPASVDVDAVQRSLASVLPAHARPQRIYAVNSFPLTRNGKLDHKALLLQDAAEKRRPPSPSRTVPARLTRTEAAIADVWRSLLELGEAPILPSDNFLGLGGHSMRQLALAARLSSTFGFRVPVQVVLKAQTLADLGRAVDLLAPATHARPAEARVRRLGRVELSPVEYEWWLKCRAASPAASAAFNVVFTCSLSDEVDVGRLASAWSTVISRHQILSSRFPADSNGRPVRDLSPVPPEPRLVYGDVDVASEAAQGFDITSEDLVRVSISPSQLLVIISHMLCDLTTLRVLLAEVSAEYMSLSGLPAPSLPESLRYTETSSWFEQPRQEDLDFWAGYLASAQTPPADPIPTDFSGASESFPFPSPTFAKMTSFSSQHSITIYQTILLGTAVTLQALTGTWDMVLGTPFINRVHELESGTVGLFLQPLPFRLRLPHPSENDDNSSSSGGGDGRTPTAALASLARTSFENMLGHAVPWHRLLERLGLSGGVHPAVFDTVVTLHDYRAMEPIALAIPGAGATAFPTTPGAKFKLLFEWTVSGRGEVDLRVEYRTARVVREAVRAMYRALVRFFDVVGEVEEVEELRETVREAAGGVEPDAFGW